MAKALQSLADFGANAGAKLNRKSGVLRDSHRVRQAVGLGGKIPELKFCAATVEAAPRTVTAAE
jgi:hypothetical protein